MAHVTLPASHSEADARLAERIGQTLQLEEVHVFWTLPDPKASVPAAGGQEAPGPAPAGLLGALAGIAVAVGRVGGRLLGARG